jgi:hypothetical protein
VIEGTTSVRVDREIRNPNPKKSRQVIVDEFNEVVFDNQLKVHLGKSISVNGTFFIAKGADVVEDVRGIYRHLQHKKTPECMPNSPNYAFTQFATTTSENKLTALAQIVPKPSLTNANEISAYHSNSKRNQDPLVQTGLMLSVKVVKQIELFEKLGDSAKRCAEKIGLLLEKYGLNDEVELTELTNYKKAIENYHENKQRPI